MRQAARLSFLLIALGLALRPVAAADLGPAIDSLLAAPGLAPAHVGVIVLDARSGEVLYARDPDKLFLPASNAKLIVAAAALRQLKPDHRFETAVLSAAPLARGTLDGDLYLRGGGDPTLSDEGLARLAEMLRARGLREIRGRVVGDAEQPPSWRPGWFWEDLQWYYAAPISALSANGNCVSVTVAPTTPGQAPRVTISPSPCGMYPVSRAMTVAGEPAAPITMTRLPGGRAIEVSGEIGVGSDPVRERLSVPVPAHYAAIRFVAMLNRAGITVTGLAATGVTPPETPTLASLPSPPLREVVGRMLKPSDNLAAEMLLDDLVRIKGEDALDGFLTEAGMDPAALRLADASGLSRLDLLSPRQVAQVLRFMRLQPEGPDFVAALPLMGREGTLANRLRDSPAAGTVRAKTGTMTGVSTLSGYVQAADGSVLVFAFLADSFVCPAREVQAVQDRMVELLSRFPGDRR